MPVTTLDTRSALPIDAITDVDAASHGRAVTRICPRIAETGSTADVLALLSTRGSPP